MIGQQSADGSPDFPGPEKHSPLEPSSIVRAEVRRDEQTDCMKILRGLPVTKERGLRNISSIAPVLREGITWRSAPSTARCSAHT
jgi:hypothetical protein